MVNTANSLGTVTIGIKAPIIKKGDNIVDVVVDSVMNSGIEIKDGDIIGITESAVARSCGLYATVDDIANDIRKKFICSSNGQYKTGKVILINPIYSRNRFATILRGIARAAEELEIVMPDVDEVGNVFAEHPYTKIDYSNLYSEIALSESVGEVRIWKGNEFEKREDEVVMEGARPVLRINCELHPDLVGNTLTLDKILSDKSEFGVLGSNSAGFERIKLFPPRELCKEIVNGVKSAIKSAAKRDVECLVYGDGCFHSPYEFGENGMKIPGTSINEFADPVTSPGFTDGLSGFPNEVKIKSIADDLLSKGIAAKDVEYEIKTAISCDDKNRSNSDLALGTTPRRIVDLVASLCDLTTGSGQKGTPIVLIQNYFGNYSSDFELSLAANPLDLPVCGPSA